MKKAEVVYHDNEEQWLAEKENYIGASEISTLFGHGYQTYYALWHQKAGLIDKENLDDVLPVLIGQCMESGLASVIRKVEGVDMRKAHRYLIHSNEATCLAASLDYEIRTDDAGWVPCELKIQDWMAFSEQWEETEISGEYDPPLKFALQLQQQLLITDKPYGYLFALVGNRQLVKVKMEADKDVQNMIEEEAIRFWTSIHANNVPAPDYDKDLQLMYKTLTNVEDGREIHVHGDDWWEAAITSYKDAADREKAAKAIKDRLRAEVLDRLGPAIRAKMTGGSISAKITDRWGKPRRTLTITPKRTK